MTLAALGKQGLKETARQCFAKAEYVKGLIAQIPGPFSVAFSGPTFNEFAVKCGVPVDRVLAELESERILGGVPVRRLAPEETKWHDLLLVAVTERNTREEMDRFASVLRRLS